VRRKASHIGIMLAVLLGTFLPMLGSFNAPTAQAVEPPFSKPAFQKIWLTTDRPVDDGRTRRSFLWGPEIGGAAGFEQYDDAAPVNGKRRWVQYFDKSRMEINNPYSEPTSQYFVTNGLLTVELISGRIQVGDARFVETGNPANNVPVAGDPLSANLNAPTYKTLRAVASYDSATQASNRKPNRVGQRANEVLTKDAEGNGSVSINATLGNTPGAEYVYYDTGLGHNIPKAMWDYMNQLGLRFDPNLRTYVDGQKVFDWLYAMGLPITDAYWTKVKVAGAEKDVLMQCFERRCLTFTPSNPDGFKVEMGNVGQHFFAWRYPNGRMPSSEYVNEPVSAPLKVPFLGYGLNAHYFYQNHTEVNSWVKDLGARWIRQQITWSDIEDAKRTDNDRFNWAEVDRIVNSLYLDNVRIMLNPVSAPPEYRGAGSLMPAPDKINKFSEFMFRLAERYKGRVDAYQVWNEPNLQREAGTGISVRLYSSLLQKGYNAVKSADANAIVVFGSLSQTETNDPNFALPDDDYLEALYRLENGEIKKYFDVMAMHASGFLNAPENMFPTNPGTGPGWTNSREFYFRRVEDLRAIMERYGDGSKQVWITEFGWSSDSNPQDGYEYAKSVTEAQQSDYIRRAYLYAQNNYPWMGVMFLWNLNFGLPSVVINNPLANGKNDEKIGFSILRRDKSKRPAYFAFQQLAKQAR
jgi:polysaccharide biosynthesis protein PslG